MFICLCNGITDSQIKRAVAAGDTSLNDVRNRLGVGDQCGKCISMATDIIQAQLLSIATDAVAVKDTDSATTTINTGMNDDSQVQGHCVAKPDNFYQVA
ncbi:bacterioferritin-associated ferredoxin [Shewanella sp. SNU WT4]|nr:bacterioferritin-associated ferredoxin [Shewanella sp. SNU WT4]